MMQKFLEAMEDGTEMDFICSNYPNMTKFDLRTILVAYMYEISEEARDRVQSELEAYEVFGDD